MSVRPTYLVAVSGESVYIGYSPQEMTQATNGANVLEDTPDMDMQDGPPSPNDPGNQKFHRHVYFADGTNYKRLDAHTGEVFDWEAHNGLDAATNEQIRGALPFAAGRTDDIIGADNSAETITVDGDQTADYTAGTSIVIQNSTGNDGSYTVASSALVGGDTVITVNEDIADNTADGIVSTVDSRGTMMCLYRNRIVISGIAHDPHNWFMSAVGDPLNWDYSPPTTNAKQAVAGNLSEVGNLGDRITCLAPFSDDLLIIGCEQSLWKMSGDPAIGGTTDNISQQIGIVGPDAWAFDPGNAFYFMGNNGLYQMAPDGSQMRLLSQNRLDRTFKEIDLTEYRVILHWDRTRDGLFIFIISDTAGEAQPGSFFWDHRTDAFWPVQLPDDNGPISVTTFDTDADNDRVMLLGGRDGYVRRFHDLRENDNDGVVDSVGVDVAIDSYVDLGPYIPIDDQTRVTLQRLQMTLAESSSNVTLQARAAASPEAAQLVSAIRAARTLVAGRNLVMRNRVSGNALVFRLSQNALDSYWAYETGDAEFEYTGDQRSLS